MTSSFVAGLDNNLVSPPVNSLVAPLFALSYPVILKSKPLRGSILISLQPNKPGNSFSRSYV